VNRSGSSTRSCSSPFDRPNPTLDVVRCEGHDKIARLMDILRAGAGSGSQIVYVGRRRDAEEIASDLDGMGLRAVAYHAGLTPEQRRRAQEAWLSGRRPIVVATIAFGMGIDKPDVRTVVHWQHPSSLEAYYQEAGRAGRDGHPARCVVLFSERDVELHHYFIDQRYPERDDVRRLLRRMPEGRLPPEALASLAEGLTEEQRNVAIVALVDEGVLARDRDGPAGRASRPPAPARWRRWRRAAGRSRPEAIVALPGSALPASPPARDFGEAQPAKYRCDNRPRAAAGHRARRQSSLRPGAAHPSRPSSRSDRATPKPDSHTSSERD
jgi:superfamily II DNA/RNA helicase